MTPTLFREIAIRELNFEFRRLGPLFGRSVFDGLWLYSYGVQEQGPCFIRETMWKAQSPLRFPADGDPDGAHDRGSFDVAGRRVVWDMDYLQRGTRFAAVDPADCARTCRISTFMLDEEC